MFLNSILALFGILLLVAIGLSEAEWSSAADLIPAALRGWNHIARRIWTLFRISAKVTFSVALVLSAAVGAIIFMVILPHSLLFGLGLAAAWIAFLVLILPAFSSALEKTIQTPMQTGLRRRGL